MSDAVHIEVMGQKFTLKGSYDQVYIERVEEYINKKIEEVKGTGGSLTTYNLMVLVALNLVDEYLKKEDELQGLIKSVEDDSVRLLAFVDAHR